MVESGIAKAFEIQYEIIRLLKDIYYNNKGKQLFTIMQNRTYLTQKPEGCHSIKET